MAGIRDVEVRFSGTEDQILERLGYREYEVRVDGVLLEPKPEVIHKAPTSYTSGRYMMFIDKLGGKGNPLGFYEVAISRLLPEDVVRSYKYWEVKRGDYIARCSPVSFEVTDSRFNVILAVVK